MSRVDGGAGALIGRDGDQGAPSYRLKTHALGQAWLEKIKKFKLKWVFKRFDLELNI